MALASTDKPDAELGYTLTTTRSLLERDIEVIMALPLPLEATIAALRAAIAKAEGGDA
jgi:hypothetical protein